MPHSRTAESMQQVDANEWDRLRPDDNPFISHAFLDTLERTGCVNAERGWLPQHLLLRDDSGALTGVVPAYLKTDSFGEFVFDFAWAHAYRQLGLPYYPKLVSAVPFSPVVGPRLLARDENTRAELADALMASADASGASSAHTLFARHTDLETLHRAGALLRRDCHYQWLNRGYADFESFLAALSSKRRKEIRRERRRVAEAGIRIEILRPRQLDTDRLHQLYLFYARTYLIRGQPPYLTGAFFREIGRRLPDQVLFFVAMRGQEPVAMAFMLRDADTLYGRHWGSLADYHSLHFETCYYAGIEYCIRHGLSRFDAGAQGEHKIRRGFEPMATYSAHYLRDPRLRGAIADFLRRERRAVVAYHDEQRSRSAFPEAETDS